MYNKYTGAQWWARYSKFALSNTDTRCIEIGLKRYRYAILWNTILAISIRNAVSSILVSRYILVVSFICEVWHHNAIVIFFSVDNLYFFVKKLIFFPIQYSCFEQQSNGVGLITVTPLQIPVLTLIKNWQNDRRQHWWKIGGVAKRCNLKHFNQDCILYFSYRSKLSSIVHDIFLSTIGA